MTSPLAFFSRAPGSRWLLITTIAGLASLYVIGAVGIPNLQATWTAWQTLEQHKRRLADGRADVATWKALQREHAVLKTQVAQSSETDTAGGLAVAAIRELHGLAAAHNVDVEEVRPATRTRHGPHEIHNLSVRLRGVFPSLVRFVDALEGHRRALRVSGLTIETIAFDERIVSVRLHTHLVTIASISLENTSFHLAPAP